MTRHLSSKRAILGSLVLLLTLSFLSLGAWQLKRLQWKLDLIERVSERVHLPAVPLPPSASWSGLSSSEFEYLPVKVSGRFFYDRSTRVQTISEQGSGYWLMVPLQLPTGECVWVNRGFVPVGVKGVFEASAADVVQITGLMRVSEPSGRWIRQNKPQDDRWYTRDIPSLSQHAQLATAASFFIDQTAIEPVWNQTYPAMGLTVVNFANNHLVYAITWFVLSILTIIAGRWVYLEDQRLASRPPNGS